MSRRPRALVIAYDFPPHAAIGTMRTLRLVQQLVREEWDVTVLTSDPATFRPKTPLDEALLTRVPSGVRIVRAPSFRGLEQLKGLVRRSGHERAAGPSSANGRSPGRAQRSKSVVGRAIDLIDTACAIPDQESAWLLPAIVRGLAATARHRPDVIYSSAPPWTGHLVARALTAALRRPWIADFRDPWARAPWRENRPDFVRRELARLERMVIMRADAVVFVTDGNRRDFEASYGPAVADRFHLIPNGCDPSEFDGLIPAPPGDRFVLLHAGSLYGGRNPLPLLRALAAAIARGTIDPARFRLRLVGQATVPGVDMDAVAGELGLCGIIEVVPRVPRADSLTEMLSSSALLLVQPTTTVSVPGKVYEYLAAGRPILAMTAEGETADIVRASGNGVVVPADDEDRIQAGLIEVMALAHSRPRAVDPALYDGRIGAARAVSLMGRYAAGPRATAATVTRASEPASAVHAKEPSR
jgi:glycosyltransferase involved in cell wall biosynthesis